MTDTKDKKRFILIDPSFDGTAGDKWQYAMTFAKSARRNGYDFILLSNKRSPNLSGALETPIDERPIFEFTFYDHAAIVSRHAVSPLREIDRARVKRHKRDAERLNNRISRARENGDDGLAEALEIEKRQMMRGAARAARQAAADIAANDPLPKPFNRDDFAIALFEALESLDLGSGDQLFFHTMTPSMLESLSEVAALRHPRPPLDVDAHFLFHFGRDASDARTFLDRYQSYSHMDSVTQRLRTGSPFARLHFLATCPELAAECEAMFQTPVGLFEGLADLETYLAADGGPEGARRVRAAVADRFAKAGELVVSVRASDMQPHLLDTMRRATLLLSDIDIKLKFRILFSNHSRPLLREIIGDSDGIDIDYVDTNDNADYIRAITASHIMLLTYVPDRYRKRVSAVLHDCSVLGVSCIVPAGTTLATARAYADIHVYETIEDIAGLLVLACRRLKLGAVAAEAPAKVALAQARYTTDVVERLLAALPEPSLTASGISRIAVVVQPSWERCGSSFAMEGQVKYLIQAGYFVIQLFVLDKSADQFEATSFFWSILRQNSENTRGHVQRLAFSTEAAIEALERSDAYLSKTAFAQFLDRLGAADVHDPALAGLARSADLTLVNHVFNTRFGQGLGGGKMILESHDLQSYQMVNWPIVNAADDRPASLSETLTAEFEVIREYDFVVNVAPEEHAMISLANSNASLVTPYVPDVQADDHYVTTVRKLADLWGLDEWYRTLDAFDLFLAGDSHPANRESAIWFMEAVYKPYLMPTGVTLALVGRLSEVLYHHFGSLPGVFYMGFVKDLEQVRRLSQICILPDQRGTGISIKTLETFAAGNAFVATSVALRGIRDRLPSDVVPVDDARAYADEIKALLGSASLRAQRQTVARNAYDAVASKARFTEAWDDILDTLGLAHGDASGPPAAPVAKRTRR